VLECAGNHVDAAADQCLQCARAAGEVEDFDVEPFRLEIAVALGDGQRQVLEQRLAADADLQFAFLQRLAGRGRNQGEQ
jgi:hypothetical protein